MRDVSKLDWNDIEAFRAIAAAGSLSAAARQTGASQPTLGRRISRLEERTGLVFFTKGAHGYELTSVGRRLLPLAEAVYTEQLALVRELEASRATFHPTIRIYCGEWMSHTIAGFLPGLSAAFPDGRVLLETGPRPDEDAIRANDICVTHGTVRMNSFIIRRLGEAPYAVFASRDYVERHPSCLGSERFHHGGWAVISRLSVLGAAETDDVAWGYPELGGSAQIFRCTSVLTLIELVRLGQAQAFLPIFFGVREPDLVQISDPIQSLQHSYWLSYRQEANNFPQVKKIAGKLSDYLSRKLKQASLQAGEGPQLSKS